MAKNNVGHVTQILGSVVDVKFDGDLQKDLVARFHVDGYPTLIVLDSSGKELQRFGYLSSKEMLVTLKR